MKGGIALLFNSFEFLIFFPTVVTIYFLLPHRWRWLFLLGASYYFYMSWKLEYIFLIILSTIVDYVVGIQLGKTSEPLRRKLYLALSLTVNLGVLFTFKYFNFFRDSLNEVFNYVDAPYSVPYLDVLLPVGISFYTFQTLSYTIDVYRGKKEPERHFGIFALYVAFFPQLVAGPIERATRLLPQFYKPHRFDYERVVSGLQLIMWGFFKKLVIADRLAVMVNMVYNDATQYSGFPLILATYLFAFQIFCDFSGYSDIAIGAARIMGIDLMLNFRQPYFAQSISEFWKRWHISLSTWFRDCLYIPLGGNRVTLWRWQLNLLIVFLVSGLWHGANWTFVIWGALHGGYLIAEIWLSMLWGKLSHFFDYKKWGGQASPLSRIKILSILKILIVFHLVVFAWIFFRANSISDAFYIVQHLLVFKPAQSLAYTVNVLFPRNDLLVALLAIIMMESIHFVQERGDIWQFLKPKPIYLRWAFYYVIFFMLIFLGEFSSHEEFVYFQF